MPQRLLSDNGTALNPSRRGYLGQLVAHMSRLGTEAIAGKPNMPTTQGKNERFHQTLFRFLDKQPPPAAWPSCRPRSTRWTTSTTPSARTKRYRAGSHPTQRGRHRQGGGSSPPA